LRAVLDSIADLACGKNVGFSRVREMSQVKSGSVDKHQRTVARF
jgi:hypothetical protein